ncbi:cytochrome P450 [Streptomyces sp. NPDC059849]|uniref:cytochrome P450 n=1 Tax=Streptomyces sp. NPDC059849 TaxID=3346969 RepID=UPI003663CABB
MQADAPEGIPALGLGRRAHRSLRGPGPSTGPSLLDPDAAHDPYRLYRILREEYPLSYDAPLGAWLISRYADVATVLTDPRFTGLPHDTAPRGAPAPLGLCHGDPRCHAAPLCHGDSLRAPRNQHPARPGPVTRHMSDPGSVTRHMSDPGSVTRHMSDPGSVTRHMSDPELVTRHMPDPAPDPDTHPAPAPASVPRHMAARIERTAYVLARRIAAREQADLVEEFCRWLPLGAAPGANARPTPSSLPGTAAPTAAAPCTRHTALRERALASFLANVLDAPDLLAALRVEPALADRAWAESLRRDPPVQVVLRRTVTEVTLSGGTLPAGADVACLIGAAGRDPERFAAPELFDPFRSDQGRSLTGPASCPAVLLGRLEARHGLRALLDAMPRLRWADGFRPAGTGLLTRGPRALLVRPG